MDLANSNSPLAKGARGIDQRIEMEKSNYNKTYKIFSQKLRKNSTLGEIILLTKVLKNRQMHDFQFNRQFCIDQYIVDFICRKIKLIIEIDGYSHQFKHEEDKERDKVLFELGYKILRFTEKEILNDLENVVRSIEIHILDNVNPPAPFSKGE